MHYVDCGTTLVPDEEVREMLRKRAPERAEEIEKMEFGEIKEYVLRTADRSKNLANWLCSVDASVREDVAFLKGQQFLSKETEIVGYNLDVKTGLLTEVKSDEGSARI